MQVLWVLRTSSSGVGGNKDLKDEHRWGSEAPGRIVRKDAVPTAINVWGKDYQPNEERVRTELSVWDVDQLRTRWPCTVERCMKLEDVVHQSRIKERNIPSTCAWRHPRKFDWSRWTGLFQRRASAWHTSSKGKCQRFGKGSRDWQSWLRTRHARSKSIRKSRDRTNYYNQRLRLFWYRRQLRCRTQFDRNRLTKSWTWS